MYSEDDPNHDEIQSLANVKQDGGQQRIPGALSDSYVPSCDHDGGDAQHHHQTVRSVSINNLTANAGHSARSRDSSSSSTSGVLNKNVKFHRINGVFSRQMIDDLQLTKQITNYHRVVQTWFECVKLEPFFKELHPILRPECLSEDPSYYDSTVDEDTYITSQDAKIDDLYTASMLTHADIAQREVMVERFERLLIGSVVSNGSLIMMGSSKNGFGARNCDLDLCLVTDLSLIYTPDCLDDDDDEDSGIENDSNNDVPQSNVKGLDNESVKKAKAKCRLRRKTIAEKIAAVMTSCPTITDVVCLSDARVPIVSFTDILSGLKIDICISNYTGVYNSLLMRSYAILNPVISKLGFLIKFWAKQVCICDIVVFDVSVR